MTYQLDQPGALTPRLMHPCICRRGYPTKPWSKTALRRMVDWKTDEVDGRFLVSILVRAGHCGVGTSARSVRHCSNQSQQLFPYLTNPRKIITFIGSRKIGQSDINVERESGSGEQKYVLERPTSFIAPPFHPHLMFHPTVVFDGPRREKSHQDDRANSSSGFVVNWHEFPII